MCSALNCVIEPFFTNDRNIISKILDMLKRRGERETCLTHVCRHLCSRENPEKKIKCEELSANTAAFISYSKIEALPHYAK